MPVHDHVDDVVAGYATGYDVISDRLRSARGPAGWLQDAAGARPRVVVRPTLYYAYLLALLGQPEALICRQGAEALVRTRLARTGRYWEWEVEDLLRHDVPYFWQVPTERHLYGGSGDREEDVFPVTGIEHVTATWRRRSRRNRDANTELLRKLLPQSPRYGRAEERRARACSEWIERPR